MQAVEVITMQEYLYVRMQVKTQGHHQESPNGIIIIRRILYNLNILVVLG